MKLRKWLLAFSLFAFTVTVAVPIDTADARGKSFSSGKRSYSKTPSKSQDNVSKTTTTDKSKTTSGAASTTTKRGFMSGGSFLKGMMIGGLAGMMFGGMFGSMGFLGNILGILVNLAALFVVVAAIMGIVNAFKRRRQSQPQGPNDRDRRW